MVRVVCSCGHEAEEHTAGAGGRTGECLVIVPGDRRGPGYFCECKQYEPVPVGEEGTVDEAAGW